MIMYYIGFSRMFLYVLRRKHLFLQENVKQKKFQKKCLPHRITLGHLRDSLPIFMRFRHLRIAF